MMPFWNAFGAVFQFHKGTIKTQYFGTDKTFVFEFQFHKGTIKTIKQNHLRLFILCFNSIKVRLKQVGSSIANAAQTFQFHKGTIKTRPVMYHRR